MEKCPAKVIVPALFFILLLPALVGILFRWREIALLAILYSLLIILVAWVLGALFDHKHNMFQALNNSEGKYRIISNSSWELVNGFNEVIFQTDGKGRWQYLNPAWKSISGYSINESLGRHFSHLLDEISTEKVLKAFSDCLQQGKKYFRVEVKLLHLNQEPTWSEAFVKLVFDEKGTFIGTAGIISQINERKHAEEKLVSLNEHLAITSSKLSTTAQLAAGIAHEVRNPMTSILGFVKLIKDGGADREEYYEIIFSEIHRIEQVLNELLALSKPSEMALAEEDLVKLCDHVLTLLEMNAANNNIEIHKIYPENPIFITCDANQIKQIIINFVKNAIEAMPDGGNVFVNLYEKDGKAYLTVLDEGEGIPKESLSKIGEPFYTTKQTGTGLGLAVCFKIIEKHDGKLFITSEPKKSTKIVCSFPLALPPTNIGVTAGKEIDN